MMQVLFKEWYSSYFSDKETHILALFIITASLMVFYFGHVFAPVIASLIIAYLLEEIIQVLRRLGARRKFSVIAVYTSFLGFFAFLLLMLGPLLWQQMRNLTHDIPTMAQHAQDALILLPDKFPNLFTVSQIQELSDSLTQDMKNTAKVVISASFSSIPGLISLLIYCILVPLLVFFFLKDKEVLTESVMHFFPKDRRLLGQVWSEMDRQLGNYIRGKALEIFLVGLFTYIGFVWFKLPYAAILAVLVGFSVVIPYVGAVVVTIPVMLVGYMHLGLTHDYGLMMLAYLIIQGIDSNILVPILFSEAVNLHPVAIIVAVVFFGGVFGFWGAFFAIPLATLVKAVVNSWPEKKHNEMTV